MLFLVLLLRQLFFKNVVYSFSPVNGGSGVVEICVKVVIKMLIKLLDGNKNFVIFIRDGVQQDLVEIRKIDERLNCYECHHHYCNLSFSKYV